jgi:hypothetical protein
MFSEWVIFSSLMLQYIYLRVAYFFAMRLEFRREEYGLFSFALEIAPQLVSLPQIAQVLATFQCFDEDLQRSPGRFLSVASDVVNLYEVDGLVLVYLELFSLEFLHFLYLQNQVFEVFAQRDCVSRFVSHVHSFIE